MKEVSSCDGIFIFSPSIVLRSHVPPGSAAWKSRVLQIATLHGITFCGDFFACRPNNQIRISFAARHTLIASSWRRSCKIPSSVTSIKTIFSSCCSIQKKIYIYIIFETDKTALRRIGLIVTFDDSGIAAQTNYVRESEYTSLIVTN